jgi:hypothetical protein
MAMVGDVFDGRQPDVLTGSKLLIPKFLLTWNSVRASRVGGAQRVSRGIGPP